ncbi:hypothetical protein Thiosp_02087 [Thiorhodovibrio litoralis]|nr:hypothetical protein Thiosp_02087 [Thiorhodovibrio litoralis]
MSLAIIQVYESAHIAELPPAFLVVAAFSPIFMVFFATAMAFNAILVFINAFFDMLATDFRA